MEGVDSPVVDRKGELKKVFRGKVVPRRAIFHNGNSASFVLFDWVGPSGVGSRKCGQSGGRAGGNGGSVVAQEARKPDQCFFRENDHA